MNTLLRLAYRLYRLQWRITRPVTLGVRVMLVHDGSVVLVWHSYLDGWHFPGGAIHRGETPLEAAYREAHEEAGAELLAEPRLLGLYTSTHEGKSDHIAVYVCEEFRLGTASDRWEIARCERFPLAALPADLSTGTERRIIEYKSGGGPFSRRW